MHGEEMKLIEVCSLPGRTPVFTSSFNRRLCTRRTLQSLEQGIELGTWKRNVMLWGREGTNAEWRMQKKKQKMAELSWKALCPTVNSGPSVMEWGSHVLPLIIHTGLSHAHPIANRPLPTAWFLCQPSFGFLVPRAFPSSCSSFTSCLQPSPFLASPPSPCTPSIPPLNLFCPPRIALQMHEQIKKGGGGGCCSAEIFLALSGGWSWNQRFHLNQAGGC